MSPPEPPRPRLRRRARLAIFVTVLLDLLGFGMILPILPFYAQRYGASDLQVGILFASYSAAQLVFSPLLGRLSDRLGRRPVLLGSIGGGVVAYLVFAGAPTFAVVLAARALSGVAASNFGIAQAYMADVTDKEERSKAMGMIGAAFGLGFVLGPAFGGLLALLSTTAVPVGAAALALVNLVLASVWLPESLSLAVRERSREAAWFDPRALGRVTRDLPLFGLMLLFFLVTFCMSLMEATLALFVQARLGWGEWQTSWLFVFVGLVMVAVQGGLIGWAVRHFGERRLIPAGILAMTVGMAVLPLAHGIPVLALGLGLLALGAGLNNPSSLGLLSQLAGEATQGGTLGLSRSFGSLARVLGPLAGTWLFGHVGVPWPFGTASALLLVSLGFAALVLHAVARR